MSDSNMPDPTIANPAIADASKAALRIITERIAAGEALDSTQLTPELLARPELQRLLQLHRVMHQIDCNQHAASEVLASSMVGKKFGSYRLLHLIGSGGMGEVWLAERTDGMVEYQVAIKRVRGMIGSLGQRLEAERQLLAKLSHPNIAHFIDAGIDNLGVPWFAMEYVAGSAITDWCDVNKASLRMRLELFRKVCAAVAHAHRHLIVHRDIKPGNVLVNHEGQPKLLDFGIAKLLDGNSAEHTANALTPAYAAPEQLKGEPLSTATDVYALGLLLFRLLTGLLPSTRSMEAIAPILLRLDQEETEKPSLRARPVGAEFSYPQSALKGDLDAIVAQALRRRPEDRYGSVVEFSADIERYLSAQAVRARPPTRRYLCMRFMQRNWLAVTLTGGIFCAIVMGAGAALWQAQRAERAASEQAVAAARALAARDFLLDVLRFANPYQSATPSQQLGALYERAVPLVREKLGNDPDSAAQILFQFGRSLIALGRDDSAKMALLEAEKLLLAQAHPDKTVLRLTRTYLADLARYQRDMNTAIMRSDQLAGRCHDAGVDPVECLETMSTRAETLLFAGHAQQSLSAVSKAQSYVDAHDLTANYSAVYVEYLQGMAARELGNSTDAAQAFVQLSERTLNVAPATHPGLLTDLMWLAWTAADFGQLELASKMSYASVQGREALFGPASRMAMQPKLQQAVLMQMRGQPEQARALMRTAAEQLKPTAVMRPFEEELTVWRALADDANITASALTSVEQTRALALGENHVRTADLRLRICAAYLRRGDAAAARALFARAQPALASPDAHGLQPLALLIAAELESDKNTGDKNIRQVTLSNVENLLAKQGRVMYDPIHARMIGAKPSDAPALADLYQRILTRREQAQAPGWMAPESVAPGQ